MINRDGNELVKILFIEDNPADKRLIKEVFKDFKTKNQLYICNDGIEAFEFLSQHSDALPDLIILDLSLPRVDGLTVLQKIKTDERFKIIPLIVLSTSNFKEEILSAYKYHANCFIRKPDDFDNYKRILQGIEDFWLSIVILPDNNVIN